MTLRRAAGLDHLAEVRVDDEPRRRIDRVFLRAPAGAEHQRRDAERLASIATTRPGSQRQLVAVRRLAAARCPASRTRADRRPAPRRTCAEHLERASRRRAPARCARAPSVGDRCATPPSTSISAPSTCVSSRVSAGPPPRSTSIDSRISSALPIVRPIGASMSVSTHVTRLPARVADRRASAAHSARASLDRLHERAAADLARRARGRRCPRRASST